MNIKNLPQIATCLILKSKDNQILTATRRNTTTLALPGGKQDPGETPEQSIIREVQEETGLVLDINKLFPVYAEIIPGSDGKDFYCICYYYLQYFDDISKEYSDKLNQKWMVEEGIEVKFSPIDIFLKDGAFAEYHSRVFDSVKHLENKIIKNTQIYYAK